MSEKNDNTKNTHVKKSVYSDLQHRIPSYYDSVVNTPDTYTFPPSSLPVSIASKVAPVAKMDADEMARNALREASIYPVQYRSKSALKSYVNGQRRGLAAHPRGGASSRGAGYSESLRKRFNKSTKQLDGVAPFSNTGGEISDSPLLPMYQKVIFSDKPGADGIYPSQDFAIGRGKYITAYIPVKDSGVDSRIGVIDWVEFTVKADVVLSNFDNGFHLPNEVPFVSEYDGKVIEPIIRETFTADRSYLLVSQAMINILGFGISAKMQTGRNGFSDCYDLHGYGQLMCGGSSQRGSIHVLVTGQGCLNAKEGWEERLKDYLDAMHARLTRVDVAADLYSGQYTPEQAEDDYKAGKYTYNMQPSGARVGNWYDPNAGKTFTVGKRESGKFLRVYEKGKQVMGSSLSSSVGDVSEALSHCANWVRVELELRSKGLGMRLDTDILVNPGHYLAGAYPKVTSVFSEVQKRISTKKKIVLADVERTFHNIKTQFGSAIAALKSIGFTDKEIVDRTSGDLEKSKLYKAHKELPDAKDNLTHYTDLDDYNHGLDVRRNNASLEYRESDVMKPNHKDYPFDTYGDEYDFETGTYGVLNVAL